ncbi:hypothetical protein T484DRAFT_3476209 [Baffinella frigidus]|nr:hypothetical protein T484DRAFT_3476209 [Cryptophyta sp. CCMP2293]
MDDEQGTRDGMRFSEWRSTSIEHRPGRTPRRGGARCPASIRKVPSCPCLRSGPARLSFRHGRRSGGQLVTRRCVLTARRRTTRITSSNRHGGCSSGAPPGCWRVTGGARVPGRRAFRAPAKPRQSPADPRRRSTSGTTSTSSSSPCSSASRRGKWCTAARGTCRPPTASALTQPSHPLRLKACGGGGRRSTPWALDRRWDASRRP